MNAQFPKYQWNSFPLHCLSLIVKGVTYAKEDIGVSGKGYIPILRANNIQNDEFDFHNLVWVCKERISKEQLLCLGDVVVATSSGSKHLVGKTASFREQQKISCGAFCAILRPNSLINNLFFKYFFQTQSYRNHISSLSKGSNINNLKNADLANIQIPVPPLAEQKRIVKKIEELFAVIDRTVKSLNRRIFWKVRAMPHWLISVVFLPVIFLPSRTILPVSGLYTPVSKLKIVVFPAPLGPIRP